MGTLLSSPHLLVGNWTLFFIGTHTVGHGLSTANDYSEIDYHYLKTLGSIHFLEGGGGVGGGPEESL